MSVSCFPDICLRRFFQWEIKHDILEMLEAFGEKGEFCTRIIKDGFSDYRVRRVNKRYLMPG